MISETLWWLPNWLAARLLDALLAGQSIPDVVAAWGVVVLVGAVVVFAWMVVGWWRRRRAECGQPPPGNLLDTQDWLADRTVEVPSPARSRYRGRRRAPRRRRPRQRVVPAHPLRPEVAATQAIPRATDEPDSTAILTVPRGRWGSR